MIVNIRGTHGSGKSTLVRAVISRYPFSPEGLDRKGRPDNYRVDVPWLRKPIYVVGGYEKACGGCDAIQPYSEIWPRVEWFAEAGHVLFEGALVSSSYGSIGRSSERYGEDYVFAFLDTPLRVCLDRIALRRAARGDARPVDPRNTEGKYTSVLASAVKIQKEFGRRVVWLNYRAALPQLLGLFRSAERERKPPAGGTGGGERN